VFCTIGQQIVSKQLYSDNRKIMHFVVQLKSVQCYCQLNWFWSLVT